MQFRDITLHQFGLILGELDDVEHVAGTIDTVSGQHSALGMTILARDGSHCMALVDDPRHLDSLPTGLSKRGAGVGTQGAPPAPPEPAPCSFRSKKTG